jgi:parvulin-like peptidyl-prolyl isomerase
MRSAADSTALILLALAAVAGIVLGGLSATDRLPWAGPDSKTVALINGQAIRQLDYQRALKLVAEGKNSPLTSNDRNLVLERLIQEELLVQRAIANNLLRTDLKVRTAVLQSVLAGLDIQARAEADTNDGSGLRAYLVELRNSADIEIGVVQ